ncbi:MAG: condensation domain-containing protein, partial [Actinomycetes bacterium]
MVREDRAGDVRIVGYVVLRGREEADKVVSQQVLREHVRQILPEYMVPQHVVQVDAFPLTPNGKIDRKGLPAPEGSAKPADAFTPPRNEAETLIATLWQEALGITRIGVHEDFFALGGHSLLAAQVISRLSRQHGVTVPMRRMFEAPTVEQFAARLGGERQVLPIPRIPDDAPAPASFMQEWIWNLEQLQPGRTIFNLPSAFRICGQLDVPTLERALEAFVARHEATRTTLRSEGESLVQVVAPTLLMPLAVIDLRSVEPGARERELMRLLLEESVVPFDLERGPLVRARVYHLAEDEHVVFFMPHHAIWDGWSFDVLLGEWPRLYQALRAGRDAGLEPITVRYRDFVAWHRERCRSIEIQQQLPWWQDHLSGDIPPLELATDRVRPRAIGDAVGTLWVEIPREEVDALTSLAHAQGTTLFAVLLAAWQTLLHRMSGQDQILVGTPVRGRSRPELEGLAGTFVNTLVLRTSFAGNPSFAELLNRVRGTILGAFSHEEVPFELLTVSHRALYRAFFSFQDARGRAPSFGNLEIEQVHVLPPVAANDVSLWVMEKDSGVIGGLNYSADLFDAPAMTRLLAGFRLLLRGVVADPNRPVSLLPVSEASDLSVTESPHEPGASLDLLEVLGRPILSRARIEDRACRTTLGEVQAQARNFVSQLRSAGVVPGDRVGFLARPSVDALLDTIAVATANAIPVPLDPDDPELRRRIILLDSGPRMVLGPDLDLRASGNASHAAGTSGISTLAQGITAATPGSILIYTSGAAGRPVGVRLTWDAIAAAIGGVASAAHLGPDDVHLVTATSSSTVWLLPALLG